MGQGTVVPGLQEWITTDLASRAAATGYIHGAITYRYFTQLSVDEIMDTFSKKGVSRNFDNMSGAIDWIKMQ